MRRTALTGLPTLIQLGLLGLLGIAFALSSRARCLKRRVALAEGFYNCVGGVATGAVLEPSCVGLHLVHNSRNRVVIDRPTLSAAAAQLVDPCVERLNIP